MAKTLIYQPNSIIEKDNKLDLSLLLLFDHICNLFPPLSPIINIDKSYFNGNYLKRNGYLSNCTDILSSSELGDLYEVPDNINEIKSRTFLFAPTRRLKRLLDTKNPEDSHVIYYSSNNQFDSDFIGGNSSILKVSINQFPSISIDEINIVEFVSFLKDKETIEKKHLFCNVLNEIGVAVVNGSMNIKQVPDLIASRYSDYMKRIKLLRKKNSYKTIEIFSLISANIIAGLTIIKLPSAVENIFKLLKKNIELSEDELNMPNREFAYIDYVKNSIKK
jgi:hypothetical protein